MEIKAKEPLALSVDIGGTFTKIGLVNQFGKILFNKKIDTTFFQGSKEFVNAIFETYKVFISNLKETVELIGVGIGIPGISTKKGTMAQVSNIPFLKGINLVEKFSNRFLVPVFMEKDSNLAALGEGAYGVAKGKGNYVLITLGTGLGCAIVFKGDLVKGDLGLAGEFGHSIIANNGRECGCGRKGCLETYVSGSGLVRTAIELLAYTKSDSVLKDFSIRNLSPEIIYKAAKDGDKIANSVFEKMGTILGKQIANLFTLFDPEVVILSGGLVSAGALLLDPIIESTQNNLLYPTNIKDRIIVSALGANNAALLGAAHLVFINESNQN